jgi:hypothetical protein
MSSGKCPACQRIVTIELRHDLIGNRPAIPGFIVVCPHCETILGAIADPDYLAKRAAQIVLDSFGQLRNVGRMQTQN